MWRWTSGGKVSQRGVEVCGWNTASWLARGDFARLGIGTPGAGWTRVPALPALKELLSSRSADGIGEVLPSSLVQITASGSLSSDHKQ